MACIISSSHPNSVIHDQGKEFVGFHFQQMLQRNGVRSQPTTVKNPQANTLGTLSTLNPPAGVDTANRLIEMALANCMFATRAIIHGTLQTTPGGIAFHRDMILNLPLIADYKFYRNNVNN
jgi:hypothetical protein